MTFTEVLIVALGVSLALLVPFGMAAIWLVVMSFARHDASEAPVQTTDKRITVLIPSHHEGASLTDMSSASRVSPTSAWWCSSTMRPTPRCPT